MKRRKGEKHSKGTSTTQLEQQQQRTQSATTQQRAQTFSFETKPTNGSLLRLPNLCTHATSTNLEPGNANLLRESRSQKPVGNLRRGNPIATQLSTNFPQTAKLNRAQKPSHMPLGHNTLIPSLGAAGQPRESNDVNQTMLFAQRLPHSKKYKTPTYNKGSQRRPNLAPPLDSGRLRLTKRRLPQPLALQTQDSEK